MSFRTTDKDIEDRRVAFDNLVSFIANRPDLFSSDIFLNFLGVKPNFSVLPAEKKEADVSAAPTTLFGEGAQKLPTAKVAAPPPKKAPVKKGLFDDDDADELFESKEKKPAAQAAHPLGDLLDAKVEDLTKPKPAKEEPKKAAANVEPDIFIPAAAEDEDKAPKVVHKVEDHSDLFKVEDDLDQLLNIGKKPESKKAPAPTAVASVKAKKVDAGLDEDLFSMVSDKVADQNSADMGQDDIMAYIAQNSKGGSAKLDLF
eukprot:Colp12_sorted_trinity150504_noHs@5603